MFNVIVGGVLYYIIGSIVLLRSPIRYPRPPFSPTAQYILTIIGWPIILGIVVVRKVMPLIQKVRDVIQFIHGITTGTRNIQVQSPQYYKDSIKKLIKDIWEFYYNMYK